jgi:hypothetical protein
VNELERSRDRAALVAAALHLTAEVDPDIATTWHLRGTDPVPFHLRLGSPAEVRGFLSRRFSDWMTLEATFAQPGTWEIRPPRRTRFEWHDGLPGESPTHTTSGGVALVVTGPIPMAVAALDAFLDSLPDGAWLMEWGARHIALRAGSPAVDDPVRCARSLLAALRARPAG